MLVNFKPKSMKVQALEAWTAKADQALHSMWDKLAKSKNMEGSHASLSKVEEDTEEVPSLSEDQRSIKGGEEHTRKVGRDYEGEDYGFNVVYRRRLASLSDLTPDGNGPVGMVAPNNNSSFFAPNPELGDHVAFVRQRNRIRSQGSTDAFAAAVNRNCQFSPSALTINPTKPSNSGSANNQHTLRQKSMPTRSLKISPSTSELGMFNNDASLKYVRRRIRLASDFDDMLHNGFPTLALPNLRSSSSNATSAASKQSEFTLFISLTPKVAQEV